MYFKPVQKFSVYRRRRPYYRRMESMRYRHQYRLYAHRSEHSHRVFHGFALARYYRLRGAVLVGYRNITGYFLKFGLYFLYRGGYGGHLAAVGYFYVRHRRTARGYRPDSIGEAEHPGRYRRTVFTQAVAHGYVGFNAKLIQKPHHSHIGRKYSGLGYLRLFYPLFPFLVLFFAFAFFAPDDVGQSSAGKLFQNYVRLGKCVAHHFIFAGQILHHIHILRTLAREHKAYLRLLAVIVEGIYTFHL